MADAQREHATHAMLGPSDVGRLPALIDVAIEAALHRHLGSDVDLRFVRLGVTPEQIEALDLPTEPRKAGDRCALHITGTVKAEAMPADLLRGLLRNSIEALLPADALRLAMAVEEAEREGRLALADALRGRT